jgi:hypothetical protein
MISKERLCLDSGFVMCICQSGIPYKGLLEKAGVNQKEEWNALPQSVFPTNNNLGIIKDRVNRLFLDRHAPFSTTSSL